MLSSHATQLTEPGPYTTCRWITFLHSLLNKLQTLEGIVHSTPDMRALNETRRGIKNNKGMANCAQHSSLISEAVYFDDGQFLPSAAGLRTSVNFYDWLLSSVLTGGMRRWRPGPGLCVKCFYSHSVSQDWGQDSGVRQPIIREILVSTQTPGH